MFCSGKLGRAVVCCGLIWPAWGQVGLGTITGTVRDATGAVVPGASIRARAVDTNVTQSTRTNEAGVYHLGSLRVGIYELTAEAPGFKRAAQPEVEVHTGDRIGVDFKLEVGEVLETIEVAGQTPLLRTETSSLDTLIRERQIEQLPLQSRNYQVLALLAAGTVPELSGRDRGPIGMGGPLSGGFVSHGQPSLQNNYLIDGIDNNSTVMGLQDRKSQAVIPSLDAVQEFKVETSNYSAEYGRNAGAVVNVTIKSGSNEFHGSAYDFVRNDLFDAREAFGYVDRDGDGKADPEVLRQNQMGATLGGPILRNRTFFFGSWEGWRMRRAQSDLSTVPSLLERQADFSQTAGLAALRDPLGGNFPGKVIPKSRWDPVWDKLLALYPEPNFVGSTRANYVSSPPWRVDRDQYDIRIDHHFAASDTVFGRVSWYRFDNLRGAPLPGIARGGGVGNDRALDDNDGLSLAVSHTHIFHPSLLNEFRFGYKFLKVDKIHADTTETVQELARKFGIRGIPETPERRVLGLPVFALGGALGFTGLGGSGSLPNFKETGTFQFLDNVTLIRGRHSLRLGADIRYDNTNIRGCNICRGQFQFTGRYTGVSLGDAFLGWTNQGQLSTLLVGDMLFRSWMFYFQDDWKITSNFTLNLGLRYELTTPWFDEHNRMSSLELNPASRDFGRLIYAGERGNGYEDRGLVSFDKNNLAPRVGFAWRFGPKWTLRSGFGVFYGGQMALGADARMIANFPFFSSVTRRATAARPAVLLADGFPQNFLGNFGARPESVNELPQDLEMRVWDAKFPMPRTHQWNLNVQRQLGQDLGITVAYVGSSTQQIQMPYDLNAAGPGDPNTEQQRRRYFSRLSAITFRTPAAHHSYHGLDVHLEKRFQRGFALTAGYTWGHSIGQTAEQFVAGDNAAPQDTGCLSCEKGNASNDTRHRWVSSYIFELPFGRGRRWLDRGGLIDRIAGGWQVTGVVFLQSGQYYNPTVPNAAARLGTGGVGVWRPDLVGDWRLQDPNPDRWFNAAAFAVPVDARGNFRFGNLGRNTLQEDRIFNWDAGLSKTFRVTERFAVQLRWEVFNITNHPAYGTPNRNIESPDVGKIRSTNNSPREMQFGLRLTW